MDAPSGKSPPVVLVVEDDPLLRMLAVEVVEEVGFVALQAGDADEAVALLEARSDISLLFTDIGTGRIRPFVDSKQATVVGQFDCGSVPGWKKRSVRRIFGG
jgi:hypothetical protein